jgi:hypothetical protein
MLFVLSNPNLVQATVEMIRYGLKEDSDQDQLSGSLKVLLFDCFKFVLSLFLLCFVFALLFVCMLFVSYVL